jgi:hypothetical protein
MESAPVAVAVTVAIGTAGAVLDLAHLASADATGDRR